MAVFPVCVSYMNVQIWSLNWVKEISLSLDILGRFNVGSEVQSEVTCPNFSSPNLNRITIFIDMLLHTKWNVLSFVCI